MKNRRLIWAIGISLMLVFGISAPILAQETTDESADDESPPAAFSYAGVLGMTLSAYTGPGSEYYAGRVGFLVGGRVLYGTRNFALQSGLQYAQRGASVGEFASDYSHHLNYLEIPVMLRVRNVIAEAFQKMHRRSDGGKRYLYFGPVVGINVSASERVSGPIENIDRPLHGANLFVMSFAFGLDASWKVGKTSAFLLDMRFTKGISGVFEDRTLKNFSLDISLGVSF